MYEKNCTATFYKLSFITLLEIVSFCKILFLSLNGMFLFYFNFPVTVRNLSLLISYSLHCQKSFGFTFLFITLNEMFLFFCLTFLPPSEFSFYCFFFNISFNIFYFNFLFYTQYTMNMNRANPRVGQWHPFFSKKRSNLCVLFRSL